MGSYKQTRELFLNWSTGNIHEHKPDIRIVCGHLSYVFTVREDGSITQIKSDQFPYTEKIDPSGTLIIKTSHNNLQSLLIYNCAHTVEINAYGVLKGETIIDQSRR